MLLINYTDALGNAQNSKLEKIAITASANTKPPSSPSKKIAMIDLMATEDGLNDAMKVQFLPLSECMNAEEAPDNWMSNKDADRVWGRRSLERETGIS